MNPSTPMLKSGPRNAETINSRLDEIRNQVRAMIAAGTLKPGERVNEQALAAQLGVGRNSAREALRSLERSGLVRITPNRGAEVCKITLEEALDLYDVRAGLMRIAGRLAASRLTSAEDAALCDLVQAMGEAVAARDGLRYAEQNTTFHRQLMAATRNSRLIDVNARIEDELSLYLPKGVYTIAQMQGSLLEHQRILEAVRNGRCAEAAEAFESHVLNGKQRMLDTVSR